MAEILDSFEFGETSGFSWTKYPWDDWTNGAVWQMTQGDDFDLATRDFARTVRRYAQTHGYSVRVQRRGVTVTVQFSKDPT
jgi:hypothetical protein